MGFTLRHIKSKVMNKIKLEDIPNDTEHVLGCIIIILFLLFCIIIGYKLALILILTTLS